MIDDFVGNWNLIIFEFDISFWWERLRKLYDLDFVFDFDPFGLPLLRLMGELYI